MRTLMILTMLAASMACGTTKGEDKKDAPPVEQPKTDAPPAETPPPADAPPPAAP